MEQHLELIKMMLPYQHIYAFEYSKQKKKERLEKNREEKKRYRENKKSLI